MADSAEIDELIRQISWDSSVMPRLVEIGEPALLRLFEYFAAPAGHEPREIACESKDDWVGRAEVFARLAKTFPDAYRAAIQGVRLNSTLVDALCGIHGEQVTDMLLKAMEDEDPWVRRSAAYGLSHRACVSEGPNSPTLPSLSWQLERIMIESQGARRTPRPSGQRFVEPFIKVLEDPFAAVRECAVISLYMFGDARALEPLAMFLNCTSRQDSLWVRQSAEAAIRCIENETRASPIG